MIHKVRWTAQKIAQRIALIEPLVYRQRHPLPPFRYNTLSGPLDTPPVGPDPVEIDWEAAAAVGRASATLNVSARILRVCRRAMVAGG